MMYRYEKRDCALTGVPYAYFSGGLVFSSGRFILGGLTADPISPDATVDRWIRLPANWYVIWF